MNAFRQAVMKPVRSVSTSLILRAQPRVRLSDSHVGKPAGVSSACERCPLIAHSAFHSPVKLCDRATLALTPLYLAVNKRHLCAVITVAADECKPSKPPPGRS